MQESLLKKKEKRERIRKLRKKYSKSVYCSLLKGLIYSITDGLNPAPTIIFLSVFLSLFVSFFLYRMTCLLLLVFLFLSVYVCLSLYPSFFSSLASHLSNPWLVYNLPLGCIKCCTEQIFLNNKSDKVLKSQLENGFA